MRLVIKVTLVAVLLAAAMLAAFAVWGESFEQVFSPEACVRWFAASRPYAWAAAIGLLVADLVLPIPATGIFAALGTVYGPWWGGLIGAAGSTLAGLVGYGLARLGGLPLARRLADDKELARFHAFFDRWGPVAVILSRAAPILPEVMAVLAGLARMSLGRFAASLVLGTVPTAFLFAWLGYASREAPWWGMLVAVLIPVAVWPVAVRLFGREA